MVDPYETLGISPQADEKEIRDRYLELVREFPPDRAPERFASIRAAYEQLRDPAVRLRSLLFGVGKEDSIPGHDRRSSQPPPQRPHPDQDLVGVGQTMIDWSCDDRLA